MLAVGAGGALVANPLVALVDTAAAGRMGVTSQAALAIGAGGMTLATWLLNPLLFAWTTQVAVAWGAGDRAGATRAVATGTVAALMAGCVVAVVVVVAAGPLLTAVVEGSVAREANVYLGIRAVGLPLLALGLSGHGALRGCGDTARSAAIALSAAVLHTAGATAVVAWELGLAALAVVGVLAQATAAVAIAWRLRAVGLMSPTSPRRSLIRTVVDAVEALRGAGPLVVRGSGLGLSTAAMSGAAASIGPVEAAAHLIAYQVWLVAALALEGWKAAAQVVVAQTAARSARQRRIYSRTLQQGSAVLGVLAAAALMAAAVTLPVGLAADTAVADAARSLWTLAAVALAAGSIAFTRDGIEFGLARYRTNARRTLRGCAVWVLAAALGAITGELFVLWALFAVGLVARIPGTPRLDR